VKKDKIDKNGSNLQKQSCCETSLDRLSIKIATKPALNTEFINIIAVPFKLLFLENIHIS
jgi:hypothetical protein